MIIDVRIRKHVHVTVGSDSRRVSHSLLQLGWLSRSGTLGGHGVTIIGRRLGLASFVKAIDSGQATIVNWQAIKDVARPLSPPMRSNIEKLGLKPELSYIFDLNIRPAQALVWDLLLHGPNEFYIPGHEITDEEACRHGLADLVLGPDLWAWVQERFGPVRRIDPQFLDTIWGLLRSTGPEYLARALEKIFPRLGELRLAHEARQQQAYEDTLYV